MQSFLAFWKGIVDFSHMENRKDYWTAIIINSLIIIFLIVLGLLIRFIVPWIAVVYSAISLLPTISMSVRRLHDADTSGWFLLISLIPIVGGILVVIKLFKPTLYVA